MNTPQDISLTEDEFEVQYPLFPNAIGTGEGYMINDVGYMFETYGKELAFVNDVDPLQVWTILDVDGQQYVVSGQHFVNRVGYLVSKEPRPADHNITVQLWMGDEPEVKQLMNTPTPSRHKQRIPRFTDADVVNPDEFIPGGGYHNIHPWLFHDHGFTIAVVFASHLQDAFDELADSGKIDSYMIEEASNTPGAKGQLPAADYPTLGTENEEGITRLGNASEPFDIESIGFIELPNPPASFLAQFVAAFPDIEMA